MQKSWCVFMQVELRREQQRLSTCPAVAQNERSRASLIAISTSSSLTSPRRARLLCSSFECLTLTNVVNTPLTRHPLLSRRRRRSLIEQGASVDATSDDGFAPLHVAAEAGNRQLVELLLNKHANPNIITTDGTERVPLHFAATALGGERVVKALISSRAMIDKTTIHGDAALHMAGKLGFIDTVNVLLDANASVDAKNNYGMTAADTTAKALAEVPHAYFIKKAAGNVLRDYMGVSEYTHTDADNAIAGDSEDEDETPLSLHQLEVLRVRKEANRELESELSAP